MERKNLTVENDDWMDEVSDSGPVLMVFLMLAVMAGTLAAAVFLPKWLPDLTTSALGSQPKAYWYGIEHGIVDLSPMSVMVPADVQKKVLAEKDAIKSGQVVVFTGPVKDQDGKVRIPEGRAADDGELLGMDYFVQGVIGTLE